MDSTKEYLDNEAQDKKLSSGVNFSSLAESKVLTSLIWGNNVKQDIFERWSQGLIFSNEKEPCALLQYSGGPCAVITAVQAYLLKELIFCAQCDTNWRKPEKNELNQHLTDSLLSIYINVSTEKTKYLLFYEPNDDAENAESNIENNSDESESSSKRAKLDYDAFIDKIKAYKFSTLNELKEKLATKIDSYKKNYGVLCFLYSLILTKGLDEIERELEESGESLIDPLHGHGSQCLTNLMLCGIATSNVFDGDKSLEGLSLKGIPNQSCIGFLTIMEYLRYCEVGWNLKNPKYPIWILASETHLTVFFSQETSLVQKNESSRQTAIQNFKSFDPDDNGFVKSEDLESLMASLDLLTDKEYVDCVKLQLDTENLGIITQVAFLNEFYPESEQQIIPNEFNVYHYNGLARSNQENEVHFSEGKAKLIDFTDQPSLDLNSIKSCLQTKWPTIEIEWLDSRIPSLN
ncbi:Ubiquitin carboxyl-terminal hydrolase MINDY-3 -like protein [Brachionus plicatilis]|uniref:Ubiquitin carboxyl-terminal hydrolase MINDY n=1 Tax=Brachionus plicatilis TaxID=10195 RepID=A0A3M7RDI8_BRAPC|nr:Ubiquitin carboxyl-terminal hydrolase MINDY-3 -like protein [Brachionus plicatilis]